MTGFSAFCLLKHSRVASGKPNSLFDSTGLIECSKPDGTPLVAGLEVTCFSDVEEDQVGQTEAVKPFSGSNEQGLTGKGGKYSKGDPWTSHVVVSGNLVTGQNPQSAEAFAQAVVKALA